MTAPNDVIHQSIRLKIMAALNSLPRKGRLTFSRLKAITDATDGNLGTHLATLEQSGYITVLKDHVGKKPRTQVTITALGRKAFRDHAAFLREILDTDLEG